MPNLLRPSLFFLAVAFLCPRPSLASQVIKLGKEGKALISQQAGTPWKKGDSVCIERGGSQLICGSVTRVDKKAALVKLEGYQAAKVAVGDNAVRAGEGSPVSSDANGEPLGKEMEARKANSNAQVSAELGGAGLWYSVFGSYRFLPNVCANLGFSYLSISATAGSGLSSLSSSASFIQIPASVSYLWGSENSFLEVLAGADFVFSGVSSTSNSVSLLGGSFSGTAVLPEVGIGYRYWPTDGGFHFRATVYGLFLPSVSSTASVSGTTTSGGFTPWGGLTFGYAF